jgi:hypothetical protein
MPYYCEFDQETKRCVAIHNVPDESELDKVMLSPDNVIAAINEELREEMIANHSFPDYVLSSDGIVLSPVEPNGK